MANILVICTANICRSPVAAALLRDRLRRRGLSDWRVESAGTWAVVARGASRYSVDLMGRYGHDITGHRSRMVTGTSSTHIFHLYSMMMTSGSG